MLRLREKYKKEVIPAMMEKFGYKNIMAVPKIEKVVINTCFGRRVVTATSDERKKIGKAVLDDMNLIAGQCLVLTKAKKSISGFKLREGMPIGAMVTLRGQKMYDFLERLINIVLPRARDFRGLNPDSMDGRGNLSIALKEHIIFPEISAEKTRFIFGLEITVVSGTKDKEQGLELLKLLGFPMKAK
ncbi:MAG: 50S ribosomal protein L5 [bacterium]